MRNTTRRLFSFAALLALVPDSSFARVFDIYNNCPQAVTVYVNGTSQGKVGTRTTLVRTLPDDWSGVIYTDANGGNPDGHGGTKAGFYGEGYYYIVDEARLNTGVQITPIDVSANNGFCVAAMCDNKACNSPIYSSDPTTFPPPSTTPPQPPLYRCPGANIGFQVTLCPSGVFPPPRNSPPVTIHPNGDTSKCLDVRGGVIANGTAIQIYDCNGSKAQQWLVSAGYTLISIFDNPGFNVDAGSASPKNGDKVKLWLYSDSLLPEQGWYYTEDKRIQLSGTGKCLDLTDGSKTNSNPIQVWDCVQGNTNQIWTFP